MRPLPILPLIFIVILAMSSSAHADVLLLDKIAAEPVNAEGSEGLPRPTRGMSMKRVLAKFGGPWSETPQVGDPPITRWYYPGFTVYFEYQYVITSVVER